MISRRYLLNTCFPDTCPCVPNKCVPNKCVPNKCVPPTHKKSVTPPKMLLRYINKVNNDILEAKGPIINEKGQYLDFEKDYISFLTK